MDKKYIDYCIDIRRKIHMYPETGYDIDKTIELISSELDKLGIKYYKNIGISSLVAVLEGNEPGKVIGFRADVDALDIEEKNDLDFISKIPGKMHACGHDAHGAILLTTLKYIVDNNIKFKGTIKAIFQAAEEGPTSGGARVCLDSLMADVDEFYAVHLSPSYDSGKIKIKAGEFNASCDDFVIKLIGKSGHAAYPHMAIDPIQMANEVYMMIQSMKSRKLNQTEKTVISVCMFNSGSANNIIPDSCTMKGTVRTYNKYLKKQINDELNSICKAVCDLHGGSYELSYTDECIPLINDLEICESLKSIVRDVLGDENLILDEEYSMGVDDFAYYVDLKKGAMFNLGTRNEKTNQTASLHNSRFNPDESSFINAVKVYLEIINRNK